jgi:hypothetical protein
MLLPHTTTFVREKSLHWHLALAAFRAGKGNNLVLAKGYLARLVENELVAQYLRQRQPDLLAEFETIVETVSLEQQQFSVLT